MKHMPAAVIAAIIMMAAAENPVDGAGEPQTMSIEQAALPDGGYNLFWPGIAGRTYFLQSSEDLRRWVYLDALYAGTATTMSEWFNTDAPRMFFRLRYTDIPSANPGTDDFDGDTIKNAIELINGTDPFKADTDGDGIPDNIDGNPLVPDTIPADSIQPQVLSPLQ